MCSSKFTNQEIKQSMWIIMTWQHISPEGTENGFKMCCISIAMDRNDDILWNDSEEEGRVRS